MMLLNPFVLAAISGGGGAAELLLHFDGSNGDTSFTDSSVNVHTVTTFGNAALTTANKKFGTASMDCDGTGDYARASIPSSLTAEFCMEGFFRPTNNSTYRAFLSIGGAGWWVFQRDSIEGTWLNWWDGSGSFYNTIATPIQGGAFNHIFLSRDSSNNIRLGMNGNILGSSETRSGSISTGGFLYVGSAVGSIGLFGQADEVRLTLGSECPNYSGATYTVPTSAFV
jgi:hypothetical protein